MRILSAGLLLLVLGCGGKQTSNVDPDDGVPPVLVYVTNNHGYPVEITASGQGITYRLGTVLPGASAKFELRPGTIGHGTLELIARGRPGEKPARAGGLTLSPGDIVDFDIATHLLNSMATIRPSRDLEI